MTLECPKVKGVNPRLCESAGVSQVRVEKRKWPDIPHYTYLGQELGEDELGRWLGLEPRSPVHRGTTYLFDEPDAHVLLVPYNHDMLIWFPLGGDHDLYVDIGTRLSRSEQQISIVDLDLDVVRRRTGVVELLDEDEFEQHRLMLGYPDDVVFGARRDAEMVLAALRDGAEPFAGSCALPWKEKISRS